jgi:tetratricopeptide (TPR) repeat protein
MARTALRAMAYLEKTFWPVCALVVGIFFVTAGAGGSEWGGSDPADLYYNLLVRGFRDGQLSLKKEAPAGLASLRDPYDPVTNAPYRAAPYFLQDASYFHGKLYLYFGITPALVLFWPWAVLTGHYLAHQYAVAIFCSGGFLVAAGLLRALRRRYFAEVGPGVEAAGVLGLGLAPATVLMLMRPGICEVPIGCAYLFMLLALAAVWSALHRPQARGGWLAAGSVAYGFAVGARPSDLFGAAILLVPVWLGWREAKRLPWKLLGAAVLPMTLGGLGLLLYNAMRFGSPFDFGHAYQLSDIGVAPGFHLSYLGYNLRLYFLAPTFWSPFFPFAQGIVLPRLPAGYYPPEGIFGILPNIPLVFLALAAPLGWRGRSAEDRLRLQAFLAAVAILFLFILGPLLGYFAACGRYEAEFLPMLILLAVAGIFGLERRFAPGARRKLLIRAGWVALLVFSIGFNLLASCGRYAAQRQAEGAALAQAGQWPQAAEQFEAALRADAHLLAASNGLANAWDQQGKLPQAAEQYEVSLGLDPNQPEIHNDRAILLARMRRYPEAESALRAALRLQPDFGEAHANLGNVLFLMGRLPEAIAEYETALRSSPNDAGLRTRLGMARRALQNSR